MKKYLTMTLVLLLTVASLTACGKFTCDICGKESTGTKHTATVMGEKVTICDDCYDAIKEGID